MKFNKENLTARFQEIGAKGSIEEIRAELGVLQNELVEDYTEHANVVAQCDQLTSDNETLRKANNKLFLQIGSKEDPKVKEKDVNNDNLSYDNLFTEEGGLK